MRDWQRPFGSFFSLSVFATSGKAFRDTQDIVQRWHDETDHGRNSKHYHENALAVNIAICVLSFAFRLAFVACTITAHEKTDMTFQLLAS